MSVDRIRTEHHVTAMVAPDTLDLLIERVERLFSHGRRFAAAHTFATYTGQPPEVRPNLVINRLSKNPGVWIACDTFGFGFDIDTRYGDTCEADVWQRYHAGQHEAAAFDDRRKYMTKVTITGGRFDEPTRDDALVIRRYNGDGVCSETVIAFDEVNR